MSTIDKPQFEHDCPACNFLGQALDEEGQLADLYFCPVEKSLITRYSSDPENYFSMSLTVFLHLQELGFPVNPRTVQAYELVKGEIS